jgi:hypothetical protein
MTKVKKRKKCKNCTKTYASDSGLHYHMEKNHGFMSRKKQKKLLLLLLPLPFKEDILLRRQGCNAPKKPKKDSTKICMTTSDFVKRRLNMDLSYVPCIEDDFWSEENEYRRVSEVLIETGQRLLSQLYYN